MITFDTYLEIRELLNSDVPMTRIARKLGVDVSCCYRIKYGNHAYDLNPEVPTPPPVQIVNLRRNPSKKAPLTPQTLKKALIDKIKGKKHVTLSSEDLSEARRQGLIDDEGCITFQENNGYHLDSQASPTIQDLISPGYHDRLLDREVEEERKRRAPKPFTPPPPCQKDQIPESQKHQYGRCPTCGGYVFLPCWECYLKSLIGDNPCPEEDPPSQ